MSTPSRLINSVGAGIGRILDAVLASEKISFTIATALFLLPVMIVYAHGGLFELVTNSGNLGCLAGGMGVAISHLRKRRRKSRANRNRRKPRRPHTSRGSPTGRQVGRRRVLGAGHR
jgi:hypothetical protein